MWLDAAETAGLSPFDLGLWFFFPSLGYGTVTLVHRRPLGQKRSAPHSLLSDTRVAVRSRFLSRCCWVHRRQWKFLVMPRLLLVSGLLTGLAAVRWTHRGCRNGS